MNPKIIAISADNFLIFIALACACLACVAFVVSAFLGLGKGRETAANRIGRIAYYVSTACVAGALIYLLQCILSGSRYDIAYVSDNSSLSDEFLYRVSALWAGQGGSMLLWAAFAGVVGVFLVQNHQRSSAVLLSFWCSIQTFFLTLLIVDDPMKRLVGYQPGMMGSGMNPLLKNPWMVVHPPVVFVAYALLAVPAAMAVQALVDGDVARWARRCLPWAIGAWIAMTAGLVLGMIWSYEVLGWGGYWGWDPVENASLVPWLLSTALVHGLVVQRQRGRMVRYNVILAFAVFLAVLYATFLTRSGVLSEVSVHAFGNSEDFRAMPAYPWLKWVPIAYSAVCVAFLAARWKVMSSREVSALAPKSRDLSLAVGVITLCLYALVVLVGTTFSTFHGNADLQPRFYTTMSVPLAIIACIFMALSPLLAWGSGESKKGVGPKDGLFALGAVLLTSVGAVALIAISPGLGGRLLGWLLPESAPPIVAGVLLLLIGLAFVALVTSVFAGANSSLKRCGAYVAHAGVALVVLGIVFSTTGRSSVIDLTKNREPVLVLGHSFAYTGSRRVSDAKEVLDIKVVRNGGGFAAPLGVVRSGRGVTMFPYIRNSALCDLYIAPDKLLSDTVTPYLKWNGKGWTAHPVGIPGSKDSLALIGMQVEAHTVMLRYLKAEGAPIDFRLTDHKPVSVAGYSFTFRGFTSTGKETMDSAGANIGVSGQGLSETVVLRVTRKPLISLLWLGTVLIMAGGCMALLHRRSAQA